MLYAMLLVSDGSKLVGFLRMKKFFCKTPCAEIFLRQPIVECGKIGYTIVMEAITVWLRGWDAVC